MNTLQLNIQSTSRTSLAYNYYQLAILFDECQTKEASENILLTNNHATLVYTKESVNGFVSQTLFHFIRSRIAFFQMNFLWFQKETLALIDFWLNHEVHFNQYFSQQPISLLTNILAFGASQSATNFPDLLLKKQPVEETAMPVLLKTFLEDIRKDKLVFLALINNGGRKVST